ncbi:unnamed protein product (macronuclear) [Paramecium tetraurelia]|uniref:Transmembrane protein n=1 Tax=Paramecium tetraurelia TaxID=5888 RepID=A0CW01_PARTE|nr:uncharacterized protein GSPATT00001170001 [Paramecium tetraurelia]CAK74968.1 unnamed protein product [Paramecium tetraurelia]|eukprot:XP_001442365.1 hypothetical protein (macronuclear) [Paramecium tetraurelia strain d4-2]
MEMPQNNKAIGTHQQDNIYGYLLQKQDINGKFNYSYFIIGEFSIFILIMLNHSQFIQKYYTQLISQEKINIIQPKEEKEVESLVSVFIQEITKVGEYLVQNIYQARKHKQNKKRVLAVTSVLF